MFGWSGYINGPRILRVEAESVRVPVPVCTNPTIVAERVIAGA